VNDSIAIDLDHFQQGYDNLNKPMIVFDLDGTLADTAADLIATLNRTTQSQGLPETLMSSVGQIVGHGAKAMIRRAYELHQQALSDELLDELLTVFLEDYAANIAVHSHFYDGLENALDCLRADGHTFAVCTNKKEFMAKLLIEELGATHWFEALTGGDTFAFNKPDGRHIIETVKLGGGDPANAIMIGDTSNDINAAKDAGIKSVAVTFGYTDHPVETLGADQIISHFDELPDTIHALS